MSFSQESTMSEANSSTTSLSTLSQSCVCNGRRYVVSRPEYTDAAVQTLPEAEMGQRNVEDYSDAQVYGRFEPLPIIGNLQTYFRSNDYQLGDFFRP